eukprot:4248207-Heterocapsa_arctica.AAC.1
MGLRREARSSSSHDAQVVSICDNMDEVQSEERGRARDYGLNAICRRSAAVRLGCGLAWRRRY